MLKKVTAILLSFLLFLASSNYILLFIERLETVKSEMRERISFAKDDLDVIIIKLSRIDFSSKPRWNGSDEFELDGKMYDVIKIEECTNEFIIYCFNDKNEEILISNFNKINDKTGEHKSFLRMTHQMPVLQAIENDAYCLKKSYVLYNVPLLISMNYNKNYPDVLTPPPKNNL
jgi:hypothetical protein